MSFIKPKLVMLINNALSRHGYVLMRTDHPHVQSAELKAKTACVASLRQSQRLLLERIKECERLHMGLHGGTHDWREQTLEYWRQQVTHSRGMPR